LTFIFHPFALQTSNAAQHESCPSTKYTTFVLGEFEVFRENLENAAKVLADIDGSTRSQRFLSGVLTKVNFG
jgi:hypothetical protein